jgi:hypothetical protein
MQYEGKMAFLEPEADTPNLSFAADLPTHTVPRLKISTPKFELEIGFATTTRSPILTTATS